MGVVARRDGLDRVGQRSAFRHEADRVDNWDALHALMSAWSPQYDKQWIADAAQAARVPSLPLRELSEQLARRSPPTVDSCTRSSSMAAW